MVKIQQKVRGFFLFSTPPPFFLRYKQFLEILNVEATSIDRKTTKIELRVGWIREENEKILAWEVISGLVMISCTSNGSILA